MARLNTITEFEALSNDSDLRSIFTGLVFCLSPEEACGLLDITFQQEYRKRMAIKKKIRHDMQVAYLECHEQLIDSLMVVMEQLSSAKRQSCGYCLSYLFGNMPEIKAKEVITFFLNSGWKSIRDRGYKYLIDNWDDIWIEQIEHNLCYWKDILAGRLVIENFSVKFLLQNWELIYEVVHDHYFVRWLYVKVGLFAPNKLKELKDSDSISYAYVLVKLGLSLDENEAIQIFEENLADDRMDLLIWCFGRMKLWNVLKYVYSRIDESKEARLKVIFDA